MLPTPRRSARRLVPLVALGLLLGRPAGAQARPDTVALTFDWAVGSTVDVDHHRWKVSTLKDRSDTTQSAWRLDLRIARVNDRIRLELLRLRDELDSTQANRPMLERPVTWLETTTAGTEPQVRNVDALIASLRDVLRRPADGMEAATPAMQQIIDRSRTPEAFAQQILVDYGSAVGAWLDASFVLGEERELHEQRDVPALPGTKLPYTTYFAATERLPCSQGRADTSCVRLVMVDQVEETATGRFAMRMLEAAGLPAGEAELRHAEISRRVEVVLEPWTLMPYSYMKRDYFTITVRGADGEGEQTVAEVRDERTWFGWTRARPPLHVAAAAGDARALRPLLRGKPRLDVLDEEGTTPLYRAASAGHGGTVQQLVRAGADRARAEQLARRRGDAAALRALRAAAGSPRRAGATLESGRESFRAQRYREAVERLAEAAADEPQPAAAHAALADALVHDDQDSAAVAQAQAVRRATPCDETALRVLTLAYDASWSGWQASHRDSASAYADSLVRCVPESGDGWLSKAWSAARRGDADGESAALARLRALAFISEGQRALGRWMLESLAPRSLLVMSGYVDYITIRMLQLEGVRADVAVVEQGALELPPYIRAARDRHGLPLPFDDAMLDSLDRAGRYWAIPVLAHWWGASYAGTLGRTMAVGPSVGGEGFEGPGRFWGNGAVFVLGDTGRAAVPDPVQVWARVRAAQAIAGPPTQAGDPQPSRHAYDVTRDVLWGGRVFLTGVTLDDAGLSPAQVAAADSLVRWIEQRSLALDWPGRDGLHADLAGSRNELRYLALAAGDRRAAAEHSEAAVRLSPRSPTPRLVRAGTALVARDPATAWRAVGEAFERGDDFNIVLHGAIAARYVDRADTALALLERAQRMIDNTDDESRGGMDARRFTHVPVSAADTVGPVAVLRVRSFSELAAVVAYQTGMAHAARGEFDRAGVAMARGRGLSISAEMRCYVRNQLLATVDLVRLTERAAEWFRAQGRDFACAGQEDGPAR